MKTSLVLLSSCLLLSSCRDPQSRPGSGEDRPAPAIADLIALSGNAPLHACPEGFSGYSHCAEPHTYWSPPEGSRLRKLGDSVLSRVLAEKTAKDGSRVVLIETTAPGSDCEACSPVLSAVLHRVGRTQGEFLADLGEIGSQGQSPEKFDLLSDSAGALYVRSEWTAIGQGFMERGIRIASLTAPSREYTVQLGGDNAGTCADGTPGMEEENKCYAFAYAIEGDGDVLPKALRLRGSGNRPDDAGALRAVGDTVIILK
jgi:hypothetical protein